MTSVWLAAFAAFGLAASEDLRLKDRISVATFYSPHRDAISSESWVSYAIADGYSLGIAYVWESRKIRPVSAVRLVDEMAWHPGLSMKSGFRSLATGRVTDTLTVHKSFGNVSLEGGIGIADGVFRSVAGGSYNFRNGFSTGLQADGRNVITYLSYSKGRPVFAGYLVNWKHPAYMIGWRF